MIAVLNLFSVAVLRPSASADTSIIWCGLCGSSFLSSVLFRVAKQDSPGRVWQITNLCLHCAFVFYERVSL